MPVFSSAKQPGVKKHYPFIITDSKWAAKNMSEKASTSDLQELWAGLKTDDAGSLKLLMEHTYALMFGYGSKFSGHKEFIQDCIQDVFIAIWQHRKTLVVPDSPKGYLLASLRRKMMNNSDKNLWVPIDSLYNFDLEQELSLDHIVFGHEEVSIQARLIKNLLSRLSERQREAIYLRFYQNLSRNEIAEVMNISEQSVSNIIQKALHSLRKLWPVGHALLLCLWSLPV